MVIVQDELKIQRRWRRAFVLLVFFWTTVLYAEGTQTIGTINVIGDTTHIEFRGLSDWNYELKKLNDSQVSLLVPAFDAATETRLKTWTNDLVSKIDVNKNAPDGRYEIILTLKDKDVESFDYLTDEPSRLIVDFYRAEKPVSTAKVETSAEKPAPAKSKVSKKVSKSAKGKDKDEYVRRKIDRQPAGSELLAADDQGEQKGEKTTERGVFDGGDPDYNRFQIKDYEINERAVIASRENIYISFPMLQMPSSRLQQIIDNPPEYVIQPNDSRENKEARLLLTLFNNKRYGLFLKTYNYFKNKYPDSKYDEIMRNLAATVYFERWRENGDPNDFKDARSIYLYLINKYPDSVLTERNHLILDYAELERKNGIETIQRFQEFLKKFPNSNELDWARKALAEGYIILNKFDDALKVYEDLEKKPLEKAAGVEAIYRKGDVYFARKDYKAAIEAYESALKEYQDFQGIYPNAYYNLAEAQFWTGNYKSSIDNYLNYIRRFPDHSHGGYALTRIGEILEILGADRGRVMGAFLESYFRFRNSEGANVARIRMISQRMKGMKDKELKKSLEELNEIEKISKLPKISEFRTLMEASGFHRRGEYDESIKRLVAYYQEHPTSTNLSIFRKRIVTNIADSILAKLNTSDYMGALDIHSRFSQTWLRNANRMDIPYFIGRAYEQAGVFGEAERIYKQTLKSLLAIQGTQEEKERRVHEHLPTLDGVNLRIAAVTTRERKYQDAYSHLKNVSKNGHLSPVENVERIELAATLAEERGQTKEAIHSLNELVEAWKDKPELLQSTYYRLAQLNYKVKNYQEAQRIIGILTSNTTTQEMTDDFRADVLRLKGDIFLAQGRHASAVESYSQLLEEFEDKRPLASVRFQTGKILFEKGDIKGAEKIWSGLDPKKDNMYRSLADEKLANAQWQDEYRRYLKRIPASNASNGGQ